VKSVGHFSSFCTTEFALFEGDDHYDAVSVLAADSLKAINALRARLVEKKEVQLALDDGRIVPTDVCAGCDLSNGGDHDMLFVSSCKGPCPCMWSEVKRKNLNPRPGPTRQVHFSSHTPDSRAHPFVITQYVRSMPRLQDGDCGDEG
jgi:hypothetical protein